MEVKSVGTFPVILLKLVTPPLPTQTKLNLEQNGWKWVLFSATTLLGEVGGGRRYKPKAEQNIVLRSRVLRNNCLEGLFTQSQVLLSSIVRANGRNIVGQQLPTLLDVTCCVRLHTLLHVVGCCCAKFETDQTFQSTTSNSLLLPDRRDVAQQCWIRWHSSSNTWFTKAYGLFFPTMYCRSQHCWELLHPLAHHCQHGRNDFQHCWRNSVGSCFRLRLTLLQNFRK